MGVVDVQQGHLLGRGGRARAAAYGQHGKSQERDEDCDDLPAHGHTSVEIIAAPPRAPNGRRLVPGMSLPFRASR